MVRKNITFRPHEELWQSLRESAEASGRSLNDEIVRRLERSFDQETLVDELAKRLRQDAVADFASRGGKRGGRVRAARMTPEQRSESARIAAQAMWARRKVEGA